MKKNAIALLIFIVASCAAPLFAQTKLGEIQIDGKTVTLYYSYPTTPPVILPPVIVPPVGVTPPPAQEGELIVSNTSSADVGGKKQIRFTVTGASGGYQLAYGSNSNTWYPWSGIYQEMPYFSDWVFKVKSTLTPSKQVSIRVITKGVGDPAKFELPNLVAENTPPPIVPPAETPVPDTQPSQTSGRPLIGVIRWDWWADNFECTTKWLSPNKYHYKAPFFAKETGKNSLHIDGDTQEIFDKELAYAQYAGLDYFAFDWYRGSGQLWNGVYGATLFKKSANKGNIKMAYILEPTSLAGEFNFENLKEMIADFGRADYQKINGRPLFFYMTAPPLTPNQVAAINDTYIRLYPNQPLPYIVNAIQVGVTEAKMNNGTGIAAWSQYTGYSQDGDIEMRERYKQAGVKLIPTLTVGWHTSPIGEQPCGWYQNAPIEPEYRLTGQALKNHLIDTINFVNNNPTICEANTILCYAWNENAEGGYIVPTIVPGTSQINTEIIEAFHQVLKPTQKEQ